MRRRLYSLTAGIALLGVGLFVFVGTEFYRIETEAIHISFRMDVDEKISSIEREVRVNFEALHSLKGAFDNFDHITPAQFRGLAKDIFIRRPDIQALEWIPRISKPDREAAELLRRKEFPYFEITERQEQGLMIRAEDRENYFPVYYVEPLVGNELALGFDLASNPSRLSALKLSRDTGRLVASASITLVQEKSNQTGFLTFLPVFKGQPLTLAKRRENLRGFVLGVFRIGDIFNSAIRHMQTDGLRLVLYDETHPDDLDILHSNVSDDVTDYENGFHYRTQLGDIPGRRWAISASPTDGYVAARRSVLPQVIVLFGLIFVAFATALAVFLLRRSQTIERTVATRTKELTDAKRELERLSRTDQLTMVANRRQFDERFGEEWLRAARERHPITLVLIDVDYFKEFNDSYGHLAGDACLKLVAKGIQSAIKRPGDFVARYGGEEFAVVLPNTENAFAFTDNIRKGVENLRIPHQTSSVADVVTISLGVASIMPIENMLADELLDCADKALYKAKASGRNRVQAYEADKAATDTPTPVYAVHLEGRSNR